MIPLPPREPSEDSARKLLEMAGVVEADEEYPLLLKALSSLLYTAAMQTELVRHHGREIEALLAGTSQEERDKLDAEVFALQRIDLAPDWRNALKLVVELAQLKKIRRKSNGNLKRAASVTDEQIRLECQRGGTREEQANRLGLTVRQLQRRLKGMTSDRTS